MRRIPPACLVLLALHACGPATDTPEAATPSSFESGVYPFAFEVPGSLDVREWAPESVSLGTPVAEGFESLVDIRLYTAGAEVGYSGFDAFLLDTLRNMCAADGQGMTISCGAIQQRQPFDGRAGLRGEVLYLDRARQTLATGAVARDGFGPVFVFRVDPPRPDLAFAALVVQPPANLPAAEVDSALLRDIARSVVLGGSRPSRS